MFVKKNPMYFETNGSYHTYATRGRNDLSVAGHSTSAFGRGQHHLCISIYNKLPRDLRDVERISIFKKRAKTYFVEKCFYEYNSLFGM